ncbi:hypothetical protein HD806DRAFT_210703 [Xylariaceae sp. AK1471]|nr:hypothetical protein HD806DRAFT_210703 [Xylariaceae sp. AK1471]
MPRSSSGWRTHCYRTRSVATLQSLISTAPFHVFEFNITDRVDHAIWYGLSPFRPNLDVLKAWKKMAYELRFGNLSPTSTSPTVSLKEPQSSEASQNCPRLHEERDNFPNS